MGIDMTEDRKTLKFAPGPRLTLAAAQEGGGIAATVRYQDERGIEAGDSIDLLTARDGTKFGEATVTKVVETEVYRAPDVIRRNRAVYGNMMVDTLLRKLNEYYDDLISPTTAVKVILLECHTNDV